MVSLLIFTVGIPAILYLLLWFSPIRQQIRFLAEHELSELLGATVKIGSVEIEPFTRLSIADVEITDSLGAPVLSVGKLGGGINPFEFLRSGRLIVSDVEIISPQITLTRDSIGAPLNVDPILARLKSDRDSEGKSHIDLSLHTAVVRRGSLSYNVLSEPHSAPGTFNPHHIGLTDISADLTLPRINAPDLSVRLKRLSLSESSGLKLKNLKVAVSMTDSLLRISGLAVEFPVSKLIFNDFSASYPSADRIVESLLSTPHTLSISPQSTIYPPDFEAIHPVFATLPMQIGIEAAISGTPSDIQIRNLKLTTADRSTLALSLDGRVAGLAATDSLRAEATPLFLRLSGPQLSASLGAIKPVKPAPARILEALGSIVLNCSAKINAKDSSASFVGQIATDAGTVDFDAAANRGRSGAENIAGEISATDIDLGLISGKSDFAKADLVSNFNLTLSGRTRKISSGNADLAVTRLGFKGHDYRDISATASTDGSTVEATVEVVDELLSLYAEGSTHIPFGNNPQMRLSARVDNADFASMGLWDKYPGYSLTAEIDATLETLMPTEVKGALAINNLSFTNPETESGISLGPITAVAADGAGSDRQITLRSDVVRADLTGRYDFSELPALFNRMVFGDDTPEADDATTSDANNFQLSATILNNERIFDFFNLPVTPIYPVEISGGAKPSVLWLSVDAPYLRKGADKLIKSTRIDLSQTFGSSAIEARTVMKTKDGDADLRLSANLDHYRHARADLRWKIDRQKAFEGNLNLQALINADGTTRGKIGSALVNLNRSRLVFNDSAWTVSPAAIEVCADSIRVNNLHIGRANQFVNINGTATKDSLGSLDVALNNIDLEYIFETLNLGDAIFFDGTATGNVNGTALLSPQPVLRTDNLHVDNFSYNHGLIGDADISALWDNDDKAIVLHADVKQSNGHSTRVDGLIAPLSPGKLDFSFYADHTPVTFLRRLLSAFATDVSGEASGLLKLYGTLKNVQLAGDLKAHNFGLTVGATNCTYLTDDSVKLTPGRIILRDMAIRDPQGHTGKLNGEVTHNFLKDVRFNFKAYNARNLLVYNVPENDEQNWFGRIYGNGTAEISGRPGEINVAANIATAPGSEFTFVLSDKLEAGEYSFLTFRDKKRPDPASDLLTLTPGSPELDRLMEEKIRKNAETASATTFGMNLDISVNPNAKLNLIMDPVSGDKITAWGSGTPNILYNSSNDDFRIFGKYTLDRGNYNFTLQDIIIKNFTIESGSRVDFNGNLDAITMDIKAIYALKANLSDLDESFLNDKEVGRTSVTVQSILNVDGPLTAPQISFDLRFPTLTSDVERKVHAIVSTEEMMNRQIIYLLALNRFYTPDYMTSTSGKGNEIVSVASSTISSQLSNILGQISDKFSLAPNLRSDAGDFSDMEFDLALSSTLLNNRLLLNGNFGYRDQILNDNQFIGDFDIEYLLNRSGNWRLKAYNHFNDRNLYVKTAMTTQGLGLVFKHDFDSLFRLWPRRKVKTAAQPDKR